MECHVVRSVLPELADGGGRIVQRNPAGHEISPNRERLEVASAFLALAKDAELRRLGTGLENRSGGGQLFVRHRAERRPRRFQVHEGVSDSRDDLLSVSLLGDSLEGFGMQ